MTTDARVLLVDSDARSRRLLEMGLKKEGHTVVSVDGVTAALDELSSGGVSVVISEIALDDGNGFDLIARMHVDDDLRRIPFVFVTESKEPSDKVRCFELGAREVLSKPVRIRELTARVKLLIEEAAEEAPSMGETVGRLADEGPLELLNDIEVEGHTGALRVVYGRITVTVYFENGALIDAVSGRTRGAQAVHRLFTLPDGSWTLILTDEVDRERTIDAPTGEVVADGMAYADAWETAATAVPDIDGVYDVEYRSFVSSVGDLPPEVNQVVRTFDGLRTLREAIADNELDDVAALELVPKLMESGTLVAKSGAALAAPEDDGFEKLRITGAVKALDTDAVPRAAAAAPDTSAADAAKAAADAKAEAAAKAAADAKAAAEAQAAAAAKAAAEAAAAEAAAREAEAKAAAEAEAKAAEEARAAELARVEAEMAELEAARAKEREEAARRAEEVRREADLLAAQLREEAARRTAELEAAEAELAAKRARLTGEMSAITAPAPTEEAKDDLAAARESERAAIAADRTEPPADEPARSDDLARAVEAEKEAMRREATGPNTDKLAAVTGPVTGTQPAVVVTPEPASATSEPTTTLTTPSTSEAASTPAEPAAAAAPAASRGADALDDAFFTSDPPAVTDDDLFAEPETSGPSPTVWAIIAVLVIGGLFLIAINSGGGDDETPTPETPDVVADAPVEDEGSAEGSAEPAEPVEEEPTEEELARIALEEARTSAAIEADFTGEQIGMSATEIARMLAEAEPAEEEEPATTTTTQTQPTPTTTETPRRDPDPEPDGDAERDMRLCANAYNGGNYSETIEACEQALRTNPGDARGFLYLGSAHYELGNTDQAIRYLDRVLRNDPSNRTALITVGAAKQELGDIAGAREAYERYVEYYPDSRRAEEVRRILETL